ncbi:MAG: DedA family protein [Planctomycetota bacterium]|jgi:membrane protein DedA with SNARE-associated domain
MELLQEFARDWIAEFTYLGPLLLLILCGFGLPLPEEVSLIGAGLLLYQGEAQFAPMMAACVIGVMAGDAIPYMVGRRFGKQALRHRWVGRVLDRRRVIVLERRFRAHRNWGTFTTRFFPGLRWPGYFLAGTLQVPPWRWFLLDLVGALIQVPLVLALGRAFGESIDGLKERLDNLHMVLAFAVVALSMTLFFQSRLRRSRAKAAAMLEAEERRRAGAGPGAEGQKAAPSDGPTASNGESSSEEVSWVRPRPAEPPRAAEDPDRPSPAKRP